MSDPGHVGETLAAAGIRFIERGWLSANNILLCGDGPTTLIDSGYGAHAEQTLGLVRHALDGAPLERLINTHLHSDHCGGNAILQAHFPGLQTHIPPGQAEAVRHWDPVALTYQPTGQECPRFGFDGVLQPGQCLDLGSGRWEIHAAKGHDPHSVILFEPVHRILVSADALWENGFGVVFPELEGMDAFDEVADTLDLIERLAPRTVLPGHGRPFQDLLPALGRARSRLALFVGAPDKHLRHAMKVLIKYRLLEWQQIGVAELWQWAQQTPYLRDHMPQEGASEQRRWLDELLIELARSGALVRQGDQILNT